VGGFVNTGQDCTAATRIYVQRGAFDAFMKRYLELVGQVRVGDPSSQQTDMGPLVSEAQLQRVEALVATAKGSARFLAGGERASAPGMGNGFFFQPTVITDVPDDAKIMTEEPFGPVAPIVPFKTFDEVVERANSLPFGLAAYAFTASGATATAIGDAMQSGMVGVNSIAISTPETPFGGIKESGYGSEGGMEGLQAYMNTKFISQS
jgi:succinate-semialdehyde dehydrogenase/glutarate-semialdehyde dehydrogenase